MGGFKDILNAASLGVYKGDDESGEGTRGELELQSGAKTWLPPRQSELEALRREVNALRIKTEEAEIALRERVKDAGEGVEAWRREVNALREKAKKAEGEAEELRGEVDALREKLEQVEVALRDKKAEEAEIVKRTATEVAKQTAAELEAEKAEIVERTVARLVERMRGHATLQPSSDAPIPSRDDHTPEWQRGSAWDGQYPTGTGPPWTRRTRQEEYWEDKLSRDSRDFGKGFNNLE